MKRSFVLAALGVALLAGSAAAVTPEERCDAFKMTASGKRILAKLRCRARAKLNGEEVSAACLDRAEKRYVLHVANGGNNCLDPDDLVASGSDADEQMSTLVEGLDRSAKSLPDLSGTWQTRTIVGINPEGGWALDCDYWPGESCPDANLLAIVDCEQVLVQNGTTISGTSQCHSPPESPLHLGSFPQVTTGTFNVTTGEWTASGSAQPSGQVVYYFASEGVYSPNGEGMTGVSTAGWSEGESAMLASTTGHRVD